MKKPKDKVSAR